MSLRQRLRDLALGPHLRRRSARVRLTALYCCLFFPSGVALVAITYVLIVLVQRPVLYKVINYPEGGSLADKSASHQHNTSLKPRTERVALLGHHMTVALLGHHFLDAREFLFGSCVVLIAMIGVSILLGWLVAGRVLRPLRVMTATTRQISERNLHERLALAGPNDELKDLGDTIDGLLARLEAAFGSQRRFIANASHELRTPLMLSQTLLQVALADPNVTLGSLRSACQEAVAVGKGQAQLIDALLTLARSQRGLDHRESVDLTGVVHESLNAHEPSAAAKRLQVDTALEPATVCGDARLISRLVSNLVDNAIRYNVSGGRIEVGLTTTPAKATLTVTNTGPPVRPDQVGRLLEPFQRAAGDRTASPNGLGLGLSIVADIAKVHDAHLEVRPRPDGGLTVAVGFPAVLPAAVTLAGADRSGDRKPAVPGPLGLPARGYADGSADDSADNIRRAGSADPVPETEVMSCRQPGSR
jgi:signal transduction histidine kinase